MIINKKLFMGVLAALALAFASVTYATMTSVNNSSSSSSSSSSCNTNGSTNNTNTNTTTNNNNNNNNNNGGVDCNNVTTPVPEGNALFPVASLIAAVAATEILRRRHAPATQR